MTQSPPAGWPQIVPYLYYDDAGAAIEFMVDAFGFEIVESFENPGDGEVLHATVRTGSGLVFVGPGMEGFGTCAPADPDNVASMTYVFVEDVDAHHDRTRAAGASLRAELHEHLGGNRQYTVSDPGGHRWTFAQPR